MSVTAFGRQLSQDATWRRFRDGAKNERGFNMSVIRVYRQDEREYRKLQTLADMLNAYTDTARYKLETTYFDYGQNWLYTSLNADAGDLWGSYQALNPRLYEMVVLGDLDDLLYVYRVLADGRSN